MGFDAGPPLFLQVCKIGPHSRYADVGVHKVGEDADASADVHQALEDEKLSFSRDADLLPVLLVVGRLITTEYVRRRGGVVEERNRSPPLALSDRIGKAVDRLVIGAEDEGSAPSWHNRLGRTPLGVVER